MKTEYDQNGEQGLDARITEPQSRSSLTVDVGRPDYPIHMIGGGAEASNRYEVRGFVKGVTGLGLLGGSLYDAATTRAAEWDELQPLRALR